MTNQPVQPGSARWAQLVHEGIIRDGNRNWFLGDAALEVAPMRDHPGPGSGELANLHQYADETGVEYHSILSYRQVSAAWPINTRVSNTCWKVHQQLMGNQGLIKSGMTVTQAAVALGQKNVGRTGPQADLDSKAAAVQDYLKDPEVASKVFADPATKTAAIKAIHQDNSQWAPAPGSTAPPPTFTKLDVLVILGEAKDALRRAFKLSVSLNLSGDAEVTSDLGDVLNEGEKFQQFLTGMGLDAAIEKILEGTGQ